jgi:predicted PurR-regulated permease PerM
MFLVELILIPVLAFSFLTESRPLKKELAAFVPRPWLRDALYLMGRSGAILQSYAVGQMILALIAGGVVWVMMTALGIRYALALAVVAAITRVIPVVGPVIGAIPIVLFATLQGVHQGVMVLILFSLMHLIESKVIMPRIIGYRIELHPAIVIIVLLIGAEFFGMWGMFLAAPAAAIVKMLFHHFFVRERRRRKPRPPASKAPVVVKESDIGLAPVAGVGSRSGAH